MSGSIPPLPQYTFVAWCSVKKHRDFTIQYLPTYLPTYLLACLYTCIHTYIRSHIHSLTHSLTHAQTQISYIHKFVMATVRYGISCENTKHRDKCSNNKTKQHRNKMAKPQTNTFFQNFVKITQKKFDSSIRILYKVHTTSRYYESFLNVRNSSAE
jgi:hypothetical protein